MACIQHLDDASRISSKLHSTVLFRPTRFLLTPYIMLKLITLILMVTVPLKIILLTSCLPVGAWQRSRKTAETSDLTSPPHSLPPFFNFRFTCHVIISWALHVPYHWIIELWVKISSSKHKSHDYAAVQMVYWLSFESTKPCQMYHRFESRWRQFCFFSQLISLQIYATNVYFHVFEMYRLI